MRTRSHGAVVVGLNRQRCRSARNAIKCENGGCLITRLINGSRLGLPGSGVSPSEAVSYPISPTGSNLGGKLCCGLIRDDDTIGGGGEPRVPCLCNL